MLWEVSSGAQEKAQEAGRDLGTQVSLSANNMEVLVPAVTAVGKYPGELVHYNTNIKNVYLRVI